MASKSRGLISIVLNIMVDLDKLKTQFNTIKDLDTTEIIKILGEHQDFLIKLALIVGSLWMLMGMFNDYHVKDQSLRTRMSQAQEKLEVVKARDAAMEDLNNFKSSIPKKLSEFELIALISNYAGLHHVTINSLSPAGSKDMGLYDVINISFSAASDNFKDMLLFLRKIEKSKFPLKINSWSGRQVDNGKITFEIEMSAVLIHSS